MTRYRLQSDLVGGGPSHEDPRERARPLEAVGGSCGRCRRGLPGLRAHVGPRHGLSGCESRTEPPIAIASYQADPLVVIIGAVFSRC